MLQREELQKLAKVEKLKSPTEREAVTILLLSYEFSQGNIPLQKNILERIATYFEQPLTLNNETVIDSLTGQILNAESNQLRLTQTKSHRAVTQGRVDDEVRENIPKYLQSLTTAPRVIDLLKNKAILGKIWQRDRDAITSNGRPNRNPDGTHDTLQDPFYSVGVKYFVKLKDTNSDAFNRFLQDLRSTHTEDLTTETLLAIQKVLVLYLKTHSAETEIVQDYLTKVSMLIETRQA